MKHLTALPRARAFLLLATFALPGALRAEEAKNRLVRESDPLTPAQEHAGMHAPEGFTVQLFASKPMINKPITLAFDPTTAAHVSRVVLRSRGGTACQLRLGAFLVGKSAAPLLAQKRKPVVHSGPPLRRRQNRGSP
jgi:hypothetical protein